MRETVNSASDITILYVIASNKLTFTLAGGFLTEFRDSIRRRARVLVTTLPRAGRGDTVPSFTPRPANATPWSKRRECALTETESQDSVGFVYHSVPHMAFVRGVGAISSGRKKKVLKPDWMEVRRSEDNTSAISRARTVRGSIIVFLMVDILILHSETTMPGCPSPLPTHAVEMDAWKTLAAHFESEISATS